TRTDFNDEQLAPPSTIPSAVWSIIARALRQNPKQRQRNASELGRDIWYYLETGQGVATLDDDETSLLKPSDFVGAHSVFMQMDPAVLARGGTVVPAAFAPARPPVSGIRPATSASSFTAPSGDGTPSLAFGPEASVWGLQLDVEAVQAHAERARNSGAPDDD